MAQLRRNMHMLAFALDFCAQVGGRVLGRIVCLLHSRWSVAVAASCYHHWRLPGRALLPRKPPHRHTPLVHPPRRPQIQRPLAKPDFQKLIQKSLGVTLAPAVLDILFWVFGDDAGLLDGPSFVAVMKSRNKVPGYRVSARCVSAGAWGVHHVPCTHDACVCAALCWLSCS